MWSEATHSTGTFAAHPIPAFWVRGVLIPRAWEGAEPSILALGLQPALPFRTPQGKVSHLSNGRAGHCLQEPAPRAEGPAGTRCAKVAGSLPGS